MSLIKIDKQLAIKNLTIEELQVSYDSQLMKFFDKKAMEKNYDNRITCSLRAGYTGPFQSEGLTFAQWMDTCTFKYYQILDDIKSGKRCIPSFDDIVNELPLLEW